MELEGRRGWERPRFVEVQPGRLSHLSAVVCVGAGVLIPYAGATLVLSLLALMLLSHDTTARSLLHQRIPVPLLLLLVWCVASTLWSVSPVGTAIVTFQTLASTALVAAAVMGRDLHEIMNVLGDVFLVLLSASWILALAVPSLGLTQGTYEAGSLQGVFVHRNLLGFVAVLSIFTCLARIRRATGHLLDSWLLLAGVLLSVTSLIASESRTALVVTGAVVIAVAVVRASGRLHGPRGVTAFLVLLVGISGAWWIFSNYAILVTAVGRDATLTGRTDIWAAVIAKWLERPFLGYGWGGVWQDSTLADELADSVGFRFYHAHSGYIDVALQTGLIGLALMLLLAAHVLRGLFARAAATVQVSTLWGVALMFTIALTSLTETVIVGGAGFVVIVALGIGLSSPNSKEESLNLERASRAARKVRS